jgi:hypothetical protein
MGSLCLSSGQDISLVMSKGKNKIINVYFLDNKFYLIFYLCRALPVYAE